MHIRISSVRKYFRVIFEWRADGPIRNYQQGKLTPSIELRLMRGRIMP